MGHAATTFVDTFRQRVASSGATSALRHFDGQAWVDISWTLWAERAQHLAAALVASGLAPGDRVAILCETRVEWALADLAILMAGGAVVPIYASDTAQQYAFVLRDSGARIVFVEAGVTAAKLASVRSDVQIEQLVAIGGEVPNAVNFEAFEAQGRSAWAAGTAAEVEARSSALTTQSTASIVYTSGTTGEPKGVVLTHGNLAWEAETVQDLGLDHDDVQLLFLPLAHIFARVLLAGFVRCGGLTVFSRGPAQLIDDLRLARPTFIAAVPRFYEQVYARLHAAAERAGGLGLKSFLWATGVSEEVCTRLEQPGSFPAGLKIKQAVAMRVLGHRVAEVFGGKARFLIAGQTGLSPQVSRFFLGFGLEILLGYGLTETTGATHVNRPGRVRVGTVGTPFPGVEVRLGDDGEVMVRGPNVMRGYHGRANATAAVLERDGWLHTGDIGEIDDDDYLTITDRKYDMLITASGKHVAPQAVEGRVCESPFISHVALYGDGRDYLVALITLNATAVEEWAVDHALADLSYAELSSRPEVYSLVDGEIRAANARAASYEAVKKFAILDREFSCEEGELTPTQKVRRKHVNQKYKDLFESFYKESY